MMPVQIPTAPNINMALEALEHGLAEAKKAVEAAENAYFARGTPIYGMEHDTLMQAMDAETEIKLMIFEERRRLKLNAGQ
jgi:hypothetical protein